MALRLLFVTAIHALVRLRPRAREQQELASPGIPKSTHPQNRPGRHRRQRGLEYAHTPSASRGAAPHHSIAHSRLQPSASALTPYARHSRATRFLPWHMRGLHSRRQHRTHLIRRHLRLRRRVLRAVASGEEPSRVRRSGRPLRAPPRQRMVRPSQEPGSTRTTVHSSSWLEAAGIKKSCVLLGERSDVSALLPAIDVATLASLGEALPNSAARGDGLRGPVRRARRRRYRRAHRDDRRGRPRRRRRGASFGLGAPRGDGRGGAAVARRSSPCPAWRTGSPSIGRRTRSRRSTTRQIARNGKRAPGPGRPRTRAVATRSVNGSRYRAMRSGPASTGSKPTSRISVAATSFARRSSPQ